jgi:hypothetical protein
MCKALKNMCFFIDGHGKTPPAFRFAAPHAVQLPDEAGFCPFPPRLLKKDNCKNFSNSTENIDKTAQMVYNRM